LNQIDQPCLCVAAMGIELRHLRAFVAVARHGSVGRAAQALRLTQPSVSMTLGEMRRALGVRPFERHGRGLRLSAAGQLLLDRAAPLLERVERLPAEVREALTGIPHGPVRVGAGEGAVLYLLPGPIRAFRRRHPALPVIVRNQPGEETAAMLRAGELDFGLRGWERAPRGLDYRPLLRFHRVVIAPRGHRVLRVRPLTLGALAEHPLVVPWPRSTLRQTVERALARARVPYRIGLEAGGWEIVKRYVALGFGVGIVPAYCVGRGDRLGSRTVSHLFGSEVYGIATRSGSELPRAATELAALVADARTARTLGARSA
jgi:DNA-binding transcriptional LysR family regulator